MFFATAGLDVVNMVTLSLKVVDNILKIINQEVQCKKTMIFFYVNK